MQLGFGFSYERLNNQKGLAALDATFVKFVFEYDLDLYTALIQYRASPKEVTNVQYSNLLIAIAPLVDDFFSQLFNIEQQVEKIRKTAKNFDPIYECKRKFVQRLAVKKYGADKVKAINFDTLSKLLLPLCEGQITQQRFVDNIFKWLKAPIKYSKHIDLAAKYAACMVHQGSKICLFDLPKINNSSLLLNKEEVAKNYNPRLSFDYSAPEINNENALNHAHYCIYCHHQKKDSCSTGFKSNIGAVDQHKNGCPLEQKISEMNQTKAAGFEIAALAIIVIDNPLLAATGHRICNDCMNSCIYQKQEPVNVPLVESNILANILKLPYGLEIYLLLTRWNPMNIYSPLPRLSTGYNILVTGLGPAGFGISYYLLREGHNVFAIDGLKIAPLSINGPIKYWHKYKQNAAPMIPQGFGGVSEYGITSRWDKNNLLIIRLILERSKNFKARGNIMLGGNITEQQVQELGFDYIALCTGSSKPRLPTFTNFLAKGVRTAADFLMTLQNQGSFLENSISSLTIRMPVAIIGCGLTAVDSAVEALNYYPVQVKKFLKYYNHLILKFGAFYVEKDWTAEDKIVADEFIAHAILFEKIKDKQKIRNFIIKKLGGVCIYYKGEIENSHAFRLNHHEVAHAIAAGVRFVPNMMVNKINVDKFGHTNSISFTNKTYFAKTVLIAIGTDNITSKVSDKKLAISFDNFGDADPLFAGSVVKALASIKEGYSKVTNQLVKEKPKSTLSWSEFVNNLDYLLTSIITEINHLTSHVTEIIVYSPLAAKNFRPGQFFRLQNYSSDLTKMIKPIALCGGHIDHQLSKDHISLVIYGAGRSSNLCRNLLIGEKIALMGPTGMPFAIPKNKYLILLAEGVNNARLLSISNAAKIRGCKIMYIAGYDQSADLFYQDRIEQSADVVVWCSKADMITKRRPQDFSITGNVSDGIRNYAFNLSFPDQIICSISTEKMTEIKNLRDKFCPDVILEFTINAPMQCMMKGICGQCVQSTLDDRSYIFGCECQIQEASIIDLGSSQLRMKQDSLQEKLIALL